MKKYLDFILEARGSRASEKAASLGLVSDQHGMWLDRSGRPVAKTEAGDLVFLQKKSPASKKPIETPKPLKTSNRVEKPLKSRDTLDRSKSKSKKEPETKLPKQPKNLTVVFARFNPPTIGHEKLLKKAKEVSAGSDLKVYPSRAHGDKLNPLDPSVKIYYIKKAYPKFADNIVNDADMKTIFDVLMLANEEGYGIVNIVTGSERRSEFDRLSKQYNGQLYNFENINVVSLPSEDPDSKNSPTPTSSARLRKAVIDDDFFAFQRGLPKTLDPKTQKALFFALKKALVKKKVQKESWSIDPVLDYEFLKEEFYNQRIFKIGDIIENLNTGLTGKIIRRGPNYVICVNESLNVMFKSWIENIKEWTDNCGVPADQREVGTDSYREYAMRMAGMDVIDNFIKKRKKRLNINKSI
jgi:hypothetical protein